MGNHAMINGTSNAAGACVACFVYGNARNGVTDEPVGSKTPECRSSADSTGDVPTVGCCDCCGENRVPKKWQELGMTIGGYSDFLCGWNDSQTFLQMLRRDRHFSISPHPPHPSAGLH